MNAIKSIIEKVSKLNGTVVLPEGMDARVITAACSCVDRKICTPIVLGTPQEIADAEIRSASISDTMRSESKREVLVDIIYHPYL